MSDKSDRLKELQRQKEAARTIVTEARLALSQLGVSASQIDKYWPKIDNYSNELKAAVDAYIEAKKNLDVLQ
jgi:Holliday junction resolvasome RuvABC DNA-binding subunit